MSAARGVYKNGFSLRGDSENPCNLAVGGARRLFVCDESFLFFSFLVFNSFLLCTRLSDFLDAQKSEPFTRAIVTDFQCLIIPLREPHNQSWVTIRFRVTAVFSIENEPAIKRNFNSFVLMKLSPCMRLDRKLPSIENLIEETAHFGTVTEHLALHASEPCNERVNSLFNPRLFDFFVDPPRALVQIFVFHKKLLLRIERKKSF